MNSGIFNEFNLTVIEVIIGSITALIAIILFGKTRKLAYIFLIIAALFLYLNLIFDVLHNLHLFDLNTILTGNVPFLKYLSTYMPFVFLSIGFVMIMREK